MESDGEDQKDDDRKATAGGREDNKRRLQSFLAPRPAPAGVVDDDNDDEGYFEEDIPEGRNHYLNTYDYILVYFILCDLIVAGLMCWF